MPSGIKIFAGGAGETLAREVCSKLSIPFGNARVGRFADGEVDIQILENVRGDDVYIINPTNPPAENFLEMALLADAAHDSSASRITLVPTYLGYNRQDRKDKSRVPTSAQVMIDFLANRGANRALLFDLHSPPTAGFFKPMVYDHLYASYVAVPYLKTILPKPFVVASPDKGGGPRAEVYAQLLDQGDFVFFSKSRKGAGQIRKGSIKIIGNVKGKNVLFVDDMIDSAGTVVADAEAAKNAGAKDIFVFATHPIFSSGAIARLDASPITEVVVTDTISHSPEALRTKRVKITVLSIAPLLAAAIRKIHDGRSLSDLFP
jgi:ribose-phosphate pyrophosphokinase